MTLFVDQFCEFTCESFLPHSDKSLHHQTKSNQSDSSFVMNDDTEGEKKRSIMTEILNYVGKWNLLFFQFSRCITFLDFLVVEEVEKLLRSDQF
jgi:cytochrome oxidase Cu insertion factor (SCO1/SenC/PrrC family)